MRMRCFARLVGVMTYFLCCSIIAQAASPSITMVYASHLANIQHRNDQGGLPELAGLLHELRGNAPHVLFIHGGNALGPSPLSSFDKGVHMVGLLNLLEPTAMAIGRRDFMHREDELTLRSGEAIFPLVCSNVIDPLTGQPPHGLVNTYLADAGDFAIGIIALVSPEFETSYSQGRIKTSGSYDMLAELSDALRREGASFVIATADFPPGDMGEPFSLMNAAGVDMLVVSEGTQSVMQVAQGKAYAVQGKEGEAFVVTLTEQEASDKSKETLQVNEAKIVSLSAYKADEETEKAVLSYTRSLESLLTIPIGISTTELDTTTHILRTRENAFANLVTDAMRAYYGADVALINSGGLRGNQRYAAGTQLVRRDLQAELPLHDTSCLTSLEGKDLLAALEYGLSGLDQARGRFLQVSGLHVTVKPNAPVGSRVQSVFVNGVPLDPKRAYTISAPAYLVKQGDGFTMFNGTCSADANRPSQELLELVRVYIAQHSPVAPKVEGRIVAVE